MSKIKVLLGGKPAKDLEGLTYRWEPGSISVEFLNGRRQLIEYRLAGDFYIFTSRVANPSIVERVGRERVAREILLRNRVTDVVAFRFSNAGSVEGRIEQRVTTLQAEELRFYLGLLAREADHFEYLLTGHDHN
jgi:hypothetical protein